MSALVLFILGLTLLIISLASLAAELFLPSHGILSIVSGLFALAGIVAMFMANTTAGVLVAILVLVAAPFAFYYILKIYPTTPMGKRIILGRPKVRPPQDAQAQFLATLPGREGIATTPLRPAGAVEFDGRRIDCVAESEIIEPGSRVRVQRVAGMKVIVTKVRLESV